MKLEYLLAHYYGFYFYKEKEIFQFFLNLFFNNSK
jgi:hypothetical protein